MLRDAQGSCVSFRFQVGSTIADVLAAHAKLTGSMRVAVICYGFGQCLDSMHPIQAGQTVQIFFSSACEGQSFAGDHVTCDVNKCESSQCESVLIPNEFLSVLPDQGCPDQFGAEASDNAKSVRDQVSVSPTLPWTAEEGPLALAEDSPPDLHTLPYVPSSSLLHALMPLSTKQFLRLAIPRVDDLQKFRALRQQFVHASERLALLQVQGDIWSDDEIAYHLSTLTSGATSFSPQPPDVLTIDPLLSSAWTEGSAFSIDVWAKDHARVVREGIQVIGACRIIEHWVPFHVVPCQLHANVFTWDVPAHDHARLNAFLESLVNSLGFQSFVVNRQQRLYFVTDRCGALATHFLHSALFGTQLPTSAEEADQVHQKLRHRFIELIGKTEYVIRPWIWGAGDSSSDVEGELQHASPVEVPNDVSFPEPVGVVCRVFDVVSPQSDPDLEGASSTESGDLSQPLPIVPIVITRSPHPVPFRKRQKPFQV